MTQAALPTFDDVVAAAQRLQGVAHRTPVLTSRTMNDQLGAQVFFKCENLQRIGARPALSHSPFQIRDRAARMLRRALLRKR